MRRDKKKRAVAVPSHPHLLWDALCNNCDGVHFIFTPSLRNYFHARGIHGAHGGKVDEYGDLFGGGVGSGVMWCKQAGVTGWGLGFAGKRWEEIRGERDRGACAL